MDVMQVLPGPVAVESVGMDEAAKEFERDPGCSAWRRLEGMRSAT